jgi:enamine deaminase RidA (YjgF/YER057c/UK114 family)
MPLTRIEPGNRMSSAVIHGNKVYLAGFTPDKALGKSVAEQTQDVLEQIDATLKQAGTDKTMILKANIWLTNIDTWAEMNSVWDKWVVPGQTPARATVEAKLAAPGIDVEIMVEAAIERPQGGARRQAQAARRAGGAKLSPEERAARQAARAGKAGKAGKKGAGGKRTPEERAARKAARQARKAGKEE